MGMFDSINIQPIKCPHCSKQMNPGLQTKDGPKCMNIYIIGNKFPIAEKSYLNYHKGIYSISVYGVCPFCNVFISGWGRVDTKTLKLKEVRLYHYERNINPEIIIKEIKRKKNGKQ